MKCSGVFPSKFALFTSAPNLIKSLTRKYYSLKAPIDKQEPKEPPPLLQSTLLKISILEQKNFSKDIERDKGVLFSLSTCEESAKFN